MAEELKPCCEETLRRRQRLVESAYTSYPVIKDIPCPTCKQILKLRIYQPPGSTGEAA